MKKIDLYEEVCKYYEFGIGSIPNRDEFISLLKQTATPRELEIFLMTPLAGTVTLDKLESHAAKKAIPVEELHKAMKKLAEHGFVITYQTPKGRGYERSHLLYLAEQHVRRREDTPLRTAYARLFVNFINGRIAPKHSKTPSYRVLAVEAALTPATKTRKIGIDVTVPDPRAVLPLDIVSKMVSGQSLIAVAECTCRKTKKVLGQDCGHPLEACFSFNDLAESLIEIGLARKLDLDEALKILADCEAKGLVHNVDNCEGKLRSLCNCCEHASILINAASRGNTNTMAVSRFMSIVDQSKCTSIGTCIKACPVHAIEAREGKAFVYQDKCIGCGQCVSQCTSSAIKLVPRPKYAKIYSTNKELWNQIGKEAITGMILNKIAGKK